MQYNVTALTPLLVGDGRELSPIDYMVWKDQVNVLDQARIFRLLARGPRLEGYLTQLRKASKLDFASWGGFAQNFSQRRIPFESADLTAIWNAAASESLFIPTFAAETRGNYLPGSALKGALRTGLVFSRWSPAIVEKLASSIEERVPRRAAEPAESNAGASQVRIFGISDSRSIPPTAFKVFLTRTASLDTRQPGKPQLAWKVAGRGSVAGSRASDSTPIFAEMAAPGTTFSGEWLERSFLENPELTRALGWRSVPDLAGIFNAANEFAAAQLKLHAQFAEMAGLERVQSALARLEAELAAAREKPLSCLIALGWGAGFLSKAAVLDTDNAAYRKILRAVPAIGRSLRDNVPFPKTRHVVFQGGQPATLPGWVRLELQH
ncbi:MAG TPA: type III-A CRISPR-associated RAMP protein Csm5 [Bryobacteraceae bacterium]|jgi:CRISPR-associated protein Csm5|nr:type III-A CRISPR-associated RAMP protein Csm5 [Bryobacteraceae bacterium]